MKDSIRFVLLLTLAKTCFSLGNGELSGFSSFASPGIGGRASRSRGALARSNSSLKTIPSSRTNFGRGQFPALNFSDFGLTATPGKRYETNHEDGGKTVVEEFSTPDGKAYGRRITRSGSGYLSPDALLAVLSDPKKRISFTIKTPVADVSNSPQPSPRYPGLGDTFKPFFLLPFEDTDSVPAKPSPPSISEPEDHKPAPAPAPVPRPSPLQHSKPFNDSSKRNEEPPATAPKPYGDDDSNGSSVHQTPPSPKPAPSPAYDRSDSVNRNNSSARGSGTPIIVKENLPNGGSVTIKIIVDRISEEEVGYLIKHARNALTAEFYFPNWKCALVSRLS